MMAMSKCRECGKEETKKIEENIERI